MINNLEAVAESMYQRACDVQTGQIIDTQENGAYDFLDRRAWPLHTEHGHPGHHHHDSIAGNRPLAALTRESFPKVCCS